MMSEAEKLLVQRQLERIQELETWLGMLITRFANGRDNLSQLVLDGVEVAAVRSLIADHRVPTVSIDYDDQRDQYILDVL